MSIKKVEPKLPSQFSQKDFEHFQKVVNLSQINAAKAFKSRPNRDKSYYLVTLTSSKGTETFQQCEKNIFRLISLSLLFATLFTCPSSGLLLLQCKHEHKFSPHSFLSFSLFGFFTHCGSLFLSLSDQCTSPSDQCTSASLSLSHTLELSLFKLSGPPTLSMPCN